IPGKKNGTLGEGHPDDGFGHYLDPKCTLDGLELDPIRLLSIVAICRPHRQRKAQEHGSRRCPQQLWNCHKPRLCTMRRQVSRVKPGLLRNSLCAATMVVLETGGPAAMPWI